ncbi:MAG: ABC transporter substrate-binding protein [Ktedonobacteraceae bacterium]
MRRLLQLLTLLLVLMVPIAACGGPPASVPASPGSPTQALTFTDATHMTITLPKRPARIACLVSLCEDILAELGLPPVAVNDTFGQDPAFFGNAAKHFTMIGGPFFNPNVEDIAKVTPDLVIGLANVHESLRDALKPIAPLYIMNPTKYTDAIFYLKDIGRLTGRSEQADAAAQRFLHKLAAYKAKTPNNLSALLLYGSDVNFNIFTQGSLFSSVLEQVTPYPWPFPGAGAAPASDHEPGAIPYSLEKILAVDPAVLFIASLTFTAGAQPLSKQLASNPVWSQLKAVKNQRVYEVNPNYYIFGRGTRSLSLALDDAMMKLYPDVFTSPLS